MQGPEHYLKALGISVECVVRRGRKAVVDSSLRLVVGHDIFFFAGRPERDRFARDPLRHCRRLTDPVTLARFEPTRRSPRHVHDGRAYYFASDSTLAVFRALPDSFAVRRGM